MQDAFHPDTTDHSKGCLGAPGSHSDDQSISPGLHGGGRSKRVKPITIRRNIEDASASVVVGFGILRISAPQTAVRGHSTALAYVQLLVGSAGTALFTRTFIQSASFELTSGKPGSKHPSILERLNFSRSTCTYCI